ncbi:MAG: transglycosylase SLT domain-containing protein [Tistlia sp.]|uniref:transglycosylase SLT domain-containing protein n=1 Tax=Tistlia sp. TaxID=3057121 RepID=UPI0034A13366
MTPAFFPSCLALAALFALLAPQPVRAMLPQALDNWDVCSRHIDAAESILGLPPKILVAISLAESGRYSKERSATLAWPWTVMAEGRGRYLPSREAAIAEVRGLKARGVRNIDVGCMQINLMYHGEAFDDVEQAFDPAFNVAYAAKFLMDLRQKTNSWIRAVARYHSATPVHADRYRTKVLALWRQARTDAYKDQVAELQASRSAVQANRGAVSTSRSGRIQAGGAEGLRANRNGAIGGIAN